MIGTFLTRGLALVLGYAYPAYECYKTVELNKPEIDQLRFWCQYWILVAALTVFERVGDTFVSWLPMYSEAKVAFFVYLWYPKTRGTQYVYETFFRPYVAKHETEIDRNLLELRSRAGDIIILYWQRAASYGQTRFLEILQYVASQSPSQSSRPRPVQRQQPPQARQTQSTAPARQPVASQQQQPQLARPTPPPQSPTKSQLQEPTRAVGAPPATSPAVAQPQSSSGPIGTSPPATENVPPPAQGEGEAIEGEVANAAANTEFNPPPQETPIEASIRVTRARLRKRAGTAGTSTQ